MRSPRISVTGLALAAMVILARPCGTAVAADDLGSLHREILEILHGEPRKDVTPTAHYCWRHARGPANSRVPALEWYVTGKGFCSAVYVPDLGAIHSPLSDKGEIIHFFFDDEKYARLEDRLTRLAAALAARRPSLAEQFDLQMTVWELIAALQFRRDMSVEWYPEISQPRVDRLLVPALKVLRATLFTREQIAALPATLPDLAARSGERAIQPLVQKLVASHDTVVEDLFPSQLHNSFSQGRLFSRVFITLDDPAELARFQAFLSKRENTRLEGLSWRTAPPPVPAEKLGFGSLSDLRELPRRYSGVHAVLILFFNVLNTDYQVVPTRMVATWNELWWPEKLDSEDLRAADRTLGMRVIKYRKRLGLEAVPGGEGNDRFPSYRSVAEDGVSRVVFLDVNPVQPEAQVTTVRGQCLSCHAATLETFDMHQRRVGFVRPFSLTPEELGSRETEVQAGQSFRDWSRRYLATNEGDR